MEYHFFKGLATGSGGLLIELGSGGGGLKELEPRLINSDVIDLPSNDINFSSLDVPFSDQSVAAICMTDTMHHILDFEEFLSEMNRVLVDNGRMIMIEQANSAWGRFIYKNFHPEPAVLYVHADQGHQVRFPSPVMKVKWIYR